jgi:hypothetical protein
MPSRTKRRAGDVFMRSRQGLVNVTKPGNERFARMFFVLRGCWTQIPAHSSSACFSQEKESDRLRGKSRSRNPGLGDQVGEGNRDCRLAVPQFQKLVGAMLLHA